MKPPVVLLFIVILGFSLALKLVTTPQANPVFQRYGMLSAFGTTIDMGLYAASIDAFFMHEGLVFAFYFPFMFTVQACKSPDTMSPRDST